MRIVQAVKFDLGEPHCYIVKYTHTCRCRTIEFQKNCVGIYGFIILDCVLNVA